MKELQQIVNNQINEMITNGKVEQVISENLDKAVKDSIAAAFVGYISEDSRTISGCITGATYAKGLAGYFYKLYCMETKITNFDEVFGDSVYVGYD